jgi:hypothetical protein
MYPKEFLLLHLFLKKYINNFFLKKLNIYKIIPLIVSFASFKAKVNEEVNNNKLIKKIIIVICFFNF